MSVNKKSTRRRRPKKKFQCHCCRKEQMFCWSCPCGFQICVSCLEDNKWGMTNGPTWICPDCGRIRMME